MLRPWPLSDCTTPILLPAPPSTVLASPGQKPEPVGQPVSCLRSIPTPDLAQSDTAVSATLARQIRLFLLRNVYSTHKTIDGLLSIPDMGIFLDSNTWLPQKCSSTEPYEGHTALLDALEERVYNHPTNEDLANLASDGHTLQNPGWQDIQDRVFRLVVLNPFDIHDYQYILYEETRTIAFKTSSIPTKDADADPPFQRIRFDDFTWLLNKRTFEFVPRS